MFVCIKLLVVTKLYLKAAQLAKKVVLFLWLHSRKLYLYMEQLQKIVTAVLDPSGKKKCTCMLYLKKVATVRQSYEQYCCLKDGVQTVLHT